MENQEELSPTSHRLVVLGTGGTIAGRAADVRDNVGYTAAQVSVADLVKGIASFKGRAVDVEQVAQVDSKDLDLGVWQALLARVAFHLERPEVKGIVVTHGTDTIEETAYLLQRVLRPQKPVVLTCAMRPATALVPDGPQNLADAVAVALHDGACGTVVVCAGQIHAADDVVKTHTYRLDAFESGDAGPVAQVVEGAVRLYRPWPICARVESRQPDLLARVMSTSALPRVCWLTSHADADGFCVDALMAHAHDSPEMAVRGLLVAGTGNGTIHRRLEAALLRAQQRGVRVVRASRCGNGPLIPHAGQALADVMQLSPAKARLALALDLLVSEAQ